MLTKTCSIVATLLGLFVCALAFATGQDETSESAYACREIEAVVTWGAGGLTDNIARNFLPLMEEQLEGAGIVVQNRAGASGAVGSQYVVGRPADGCTLLVTTTESAGVWNVMGTSDLDVTDFEPIILLSSLTPTVYVGADSPWNSVQELVADARSRPGEIIAGFAAPGSLGHVSGLLFSEHTDSDFNLVPFGGGGQVMAALLGGHVQVAFNPLVSIMEHYEAGTIRLLATFSNETLLEGVPALGRELPQFAEYLPFGVMAMILVHRDTPQQVVQTLTDAASTAFHDPQWEEFAHQHFIQLMGQTGDAFWDTIDAYKPTTTWLLYDAGVAAHSPADFGIERR